MLIPFNFSYNDYINVTNDIWCYESTGLCYDEYSSNGTVVQSRSSSRNSEYFNNFDITSISSFNDAFYYYYITNIPGSSPYVNIDFYFCTDGTFEENEVSWANRNTIIDSSSCSLIDSIPLNTFIPYEYNKLNITSYSLTDKTFTIKSIPNPSSYDTTARGIYVGEGDFSPNNIAYINLTIKTKMYLNILYPLVNSSITSWNGSINIYSNTSIDSCSINISNYSYISIDNNNKRFDNISSNYGYKYYKINCSSSDSDYIGNDIYFYINYYELPTPPSDDEDEETGTTSGVIIDFSDLIIFMTIILCYVLLKILFRNDNPMIYNILLFFLGVGVILYFIGLSFIHPIFKTVIVLSITGFLIFEMAKR